MYMVALGFRQVDDLVWQHSAGTMFVVLSSVERVIVRHVWAMRCSDESVVTGQMSVWWFFGIHHVSPWHFSIGWDTSWYLLRHCWLVLPWERCPLYYMCASLCPVCDVQMSAMMMIRDEVSWADECYDDDTWWGVMSRCVLWCHMKICVSLFIWYMRQYLLCVKDKVLWDVMSDDTGYPYVLVNGILLCIWDVCWDDSWIVLLNAMICLYMITWDR